MSNNGKVSRNNFECAEDTSKFNEEFIKSDNEKKDGGCFFEVDVQYSEKLHEIHKFLLF